MADVDNYDYERELPPVVRPLVRESVSGRKALNIGSFARRVVGMEEAAGRALMDELLARATQPEHIYTHRWLPGEMMICENRCNMHRGTEYDCANHRRDLRRAVVNEYGEEQVASRA